MRLKKLLASILVACMVFTAVPVTVLAGESAQPVYVAEIVGGNKYTSIQEAVNMAENNATITLIADYDFTDAQLGTLDGKYDTVAVVKEKTVTIDLNGKTISGTYNGERMLVGVFSTEQNGHLILKDSSNGKGKVDVKAGTGTVYYLLSSYNPGCTIIIEGGNYILDKAGDALIHSNSNEGVIVNGGNFTLNNVGSTGNNGRPWIFNVNGQNAGRVIVNGGTFNADVSSQYWKYEVKVPNNKACKNNNDGTWTIINAVASLKDDDGNLHNGGRATLAEAIADAAADQIITLLKGGKITSGIVNGVIDTNGNSLTIKGGTFAPKVEEETEFYLKKYLCPDCTVTKNAEGMWEVLPPVAQIGDVKYTSIQAAVDAAKDGDTITVIADHEMDCAKTVENSLGYAILVNVAEKKVAIDLNGKKITVDASAKYFAECEDEELLAVFAVDTNGILTLIDSGNGNGEVKVNANDANVYSLLGCYGAGGKLVIENGNYSSDKVSSALIYSQYDEVITVSGGNFHLGNVGTGSNGSPWIFNANGQNTKNIIVNGGTFNADILHQYYPFEVMAPKNRALKNNGDGTWTMVDAVAYVNEQHKSGNWYTNEVGFVTLEEAIAAADCFKEQSNYDKNGELHIAQAEQVTLLKDCMISSDIEKEVDINVENGCTLKIADGEINANIIVKEGGKAKISGGSFKSADGETFYLESSVVEGCIAEWNTTTEMWDIVTAPGSVATIGNVGYKTLAAAVAAVEDGDTIVLLENNAENVTVSREVTFTLDKNSKEFTGSIVAGSGYGKEVENNIYTFTENVSEPTPSRGGGGSTKYKATVDNDEIENGSVKLSSKRVSKGSTVTITVTPNEGYELAELIVLDKDGNEVELTDKGDGKFTFKMPNGGVEIEASFEEIDTDDPEVIPSEGDKEETTLVLTIGQAIYQLDGKYEVNDVAPIIEADRAYLPIRLVAEALGATVTWSEADQSVTIVKGDTTIVIYIGQAFALVNGNPVELDEPAFIANDRTYLPVRFVAENLGADVTWDAETQTVTIIG